MSWWFSALFKSTFSPFIFDWAHIEYKSFLSFKWHNKNSSNFSFEYLIIMIINYRMTINGSTLIHSSCSFWSNGFVLFDATVTFQFLIIFNWFAYTIYQSIDLFVCDDDYEHWLKIDKLALDASANQLRHSSSFISLELMKRFFLSTSFQTPNNNNLWLTYTKCASEKIPAPDTQTIPCRMSEKGN